MFPSKGRGTVGFKDGRGGAWHTVSASGWRGGVVGSWGDPPCLLVSINHVCLPMETYIDCDIACNWQDIFKHGEESVESPTMPKVIVCVYACMPVNKMCASAV